MYNFTVIIPHKNIPELLKRAIESVPQREDLQLIVVDDNSDPGKVDFEHFPGLDRPNTEIILTKEGRGAGYVRNVGLDHAQGKWVLFMDADDEFTFEINYILEQSLSMVDTDLIYFNSAAKDIETGEIDTDFIYTQKINEACGGFDSNVRYIVNAPWSKIIDRNLLTNIGLRFDETKCYNDWMFSVKLAESCQSFGLINRIGYIYSYRQSSLTFQTDIQTELCRLRVAKRVRRYAKRHGITYQHESACIQITDTINRLKRLNKPIYYRELIKEGIATGKIFGQIGAALKNKWKSH